MCRIWTKPQTEIPLNNLSVFSSILLLHNPEYLTPSALNSPLTENIELCSIYTLFLCPSPSYSIIIFNNSPPGVSGSGWWTRHQPVPTRSVICWPTSACSTGQYNTLREFVKKGNDLLEEEKLVGSSAARQRESCQVGIMSCSAICCYPMDACATGVK